MVTRGLELFDRVSEMLFARGPGLTISRDELPTLVPLARRAVSQSGNPAATVAALRYRLSVMRGQTKDLRNVQAMAAVANELKQKLLPRGVVRDVIWPTVEVSGQRFKIETTTWRRHGRGPFPLVVMSHGSCGGIGMLRPDSDDARRLFADLRGLDYEALSRWFVSRGYMVAVPVRRGYGDSQGRMVERVVRGEDATYLEANRAAARDLRAVVETLRSRSFVDGNNIVLAGQSAGGMASLALASEGLGGLRAVVAFAPSRGQIGNGRGTDGQSTHFRLDQLHAAYATYGARIKVPTKWLGTLNDSYVTPETLKGYVAAFEGGGGQAQLELLPAHGEEGHAFYDAPVSWGPSVAPFLAAQGLPSEPRP
jgi:dienelactone hydrolase